MLINWPELRGAATEAMRRAHAPYSQFQVGAAGLVDDGRVVVGCNVESASYGVTLCAECGVISALHGSGGGRLVALSCVDAAGSALMPCGRCRQLLWEHGGPACLVDADPAPLSVAELLPYAFDVTALDLVGIVPGRVPGRPVVPVHLAGWQGRGTVVVHADAAGGQQVWTGYWERSEATLTVPDSSEPGGRAEPGGPTRRSGNGQEFGILEEAPTWPEIADAVAWGRARTPRVVVIERDGAVRWAGAGDPPTGVTGRWQAPR